MPIATGCKAAVAAYLVSFDVHAVWAALDRTQETWKHITYALLHGMLDRAAGLRLREPPALARASADAARLFERAAPLLLLAQCMAPSHRAITAIMLDSAHTPLGKALCDLEEALLCQQKNMARSITDRLMLAAASDFTHAREAGDIRRIYREWLPQAAFEAPLIQASMRKTEAALTMHAQADFAHAVRTLAQGIFAGTNPHALLNQLHSTSSHDHEDARLLHQLVAWKRGLGPRIGHLTSVARDACTLENRLLLQLLEEHITCRDVALLVCDLLSDESAMRAFVTLSASSDGNPALQAMSLCQDSRLLDAL
jgi:hypothetical protein